MRNYIFYGSWVLIVCSYEPGTQLLSNHTNAEPLLGFCLHVFCQDGSPQWVDCLATMGNKCKVSSPKTQQRIASVRIGPGVSNHSINSLTSLQSIYLWLLMKLIQFTYIRIFNNSSPTKTISSIRLRINSCCHCSYSATRIINWYIRNGLSHHHFEEK